MKTVVRYDLNKFKKAKKLDSGFLKASVFATRTGVFTYYKPDGKVVREYRPPEEVFKADSMNSLQGVPLTNRHPKESVNSRNAKKYSIGYTSDVVKKSDNFIETSVTITDQDMIDELENSTLREVSCGYACRIDETPGETPNGETYDVIQRDITYNHLAIVDRGRAGEDVRLHLDSNDDLIFKTENQTPNKGENMSKASIKLDGVNYEVEAMLAKPVMNAIETARKSGEDTVQAKMDAALEDSKKALDELQAKFDEQTKTLEETKLDAKALNALVNERVSVVATAKKHLAEDVKFDELSNDELKKLVVENAGVDLTEKSEVYISARFDAIEEGDKEEEAEKGTDEKLKEEMEKAGEKCTEQKADSKKLSYDQLVAKRQQEDMNAWQQPIGYRAKNK